ncbi:uncharacterized protein LOC123308309 [Coccinella septempunctata]|uniref:uncharacterized protein LOC123308309 n=1 Tax=Coccinella septempunctata TaxID=41139 RepID=UPI001D06DD7A|nr:uncharacterized protein LOC123308309 [Coccinella septempunctata]
MSFQRCFTLAFGILCLFCNSGYCFNLTKITGTWIVAQTSDQMEATACPFIRINETNKKTAMMIYESNRTSPFQLTLNNSYNSIHQVMDSFNANGNMTVFGGLLPFYVVVGVRLKKENATYFVLTGRLSVPEDVKKNMTKLFNETAELKKVRLYPVETESIECRLYLGKHINKPDAGYPDVKTEVITWSNATTTTTTMTPPTTPTTKKPNAGSAPYVSNFAVLISILLVCAQ